MTGQGFIAVLALIAIVVIFAWAVVDHLRTVESPAEELPFVRSHRAPGRWTL
jgi:hypothetical protein